MELHSIEVATVKSRTLPMQETVIMPIGDIQLDPYLKGTKPGERNCDVQRLRRHVAWGVEHNAYYIGMGDYADVPSPSGRQKLRAAGLYDSVHDALDAQAEETQAELEDIFAKTKGRWLGLLEGHHYHEYQDGTTTDTRLAQYLHAPHLGTTALVEVRFARPEGSHKRAPSCVIWASHGTGSGSDEAVLRKLSKQVHAWDADVFIMGHFHRKPMNKTPRMRARFGTNPRLEYKNIVLAGTGGFLKGYRVGTRRGQVPRGGYVEQGALPPIALGGIMLWLRPRYDNDGYAEVDIDVSA